MYQFAKYVMPGLSTRCDERVRVVINGGTAFPEISETYYIAYRPRMTIRQVLAATEAVEFGSFGQIVSVRGIRIGNGVSLRITIGGRTFPPASIGLPAASRGTIALYPSPMAVPYA